MTDTPPLLTHMAVMVQLVTRGKDAGLPLPNVAAIASEYEVALQWDSFDDVETWAEFLDVQLEDYATDTDLHRGGTLTFSGVRVRLACCKRITVAV